MVGFICVGIDVGENSVGFATVRLDSDGRFLELLNLLVVTHDSGKDGMASGQTSTVSRKASGGMARRVRRLLRNRRKRAIRLEAALTGLGWPVPPRDEPTTYGPWDARLALLQGFVADEAERLRLLAIAIRHMSNHRGWANAWVGIDTYIDNDQASKEFAEAVKRIREADALGMLADTALEYQSDLAAIGIDSGVLIRQRSGRPNLLGTQRRVDVLREWNRICEVQQVAPTVRRELAKIAFGQQKPTVPVERVGNDWLPGYTDRKRAALASMEHQEFKIRSMVANLAVRPSTRSKERAPLSVQDQQLIVDHLLSVTSKEEQPTWKDLAERFLGIDPWRLAHHEPSEQLAGLAPVNAAVVAIHSLGKKHPVLQWWVAASDARRSDFIRWFADPAGTPAELGIAEDVDAEFQSMLEDLDEQQIDALQKLKFPSGRSAHSVEALRMLNASIEASGESYVTARNRIFGDGRDIRPKGLGLDAEAEHPTLQRILPIVRRYLLGIERNFGKPDRVVIEHVRGAFLGFEAKQAAQLEMLRNRRDRENAQRAIAEAGLGIDHASDGMIRKFQAFQRQNSACLYCGATPGWSGMEMDHLVPRASGGNSTQGNLVAVCRECNAAKGKVPFAVFAASGRRPGVTADDAVARVDAMLRGSLDGRRFGRLKAEIKRRLRQTEEDEPIDERALASTAYAAIEVRDRIMTSLGLGPGSVPVYAGRITQAARSASGIDRMIRIREGVNVKSRFDRRHHAIDALVAALLDPSVARTLAERDDLRRAAMDTNGDMGWKEYAGSGPAAIERFRAWQETMRAAAKATEVMIEADEAIVTQPVRFSAHHAALHEDGRKPHATKPLGSAWTADERALIVDHRVYAAVSTGVSPSESLSDDPARTIRLPGGVQLGAADPVYLFPDTAARIPLPNLSSSRLGQSMHHARLYRWADAKGKPQAGVVRIWASDLYDVVGGINADPLTAELLESSRAVRRALPKVREAIWSGEAVLAGTFVVGDEILIDPNEWAGNNEPGRFLAEWPERHWRLVGLMSEIQFTMVPMLLSQEGIVLESDFDAAEDARKVPVSPGAKKVIADRLLFTASALWNTKSTRVIRRNGIGDVLPPDVGGGLRGSWSPYEAVFGG